jgi:hypothetical protein
MWYCALLPIIDGLLSTHNNEEEAFDWVSPFIITTMRVSELATTRSADFFSQNHNNCPSHGVSYYYSSPSLSPTFLPSAVEAICGMQDIQYLDLKK